MAKLSFSEADHTHSILGRSQGGGGDQSDRGTTLPYEHKVMLSEEQQKFENEFVNGFTEIQQVQQSRCDCVHDVYCLCEFLFPNAQETSSSGIKAFVSISLPTYY